LRWLKTHGSTHFRRWSDSGLYPELLADDVVIPNE
jgi:hypothetical protein